MSSNRLYYHLKPYLPWRLRMAVRRLVARRQLRTCAGVWPINEAAGQPPARWPGWPDGKQFAFVITHDVEGPAGLAKCRRLMQLEQELGFRSSFNFIPEGGYAVSHELREELVRNGFEVGVHDLHHDGKLFWTREEFSENARWINRYLKDWGATGFRAGFMLRKLDWLHELEVQYDSSTFDTDPFEPQPDGAGTIFPFWVPKPKSPIANRQSPIENTHSSLVTRHPSLADGYVELPYTLPQDSTLFLLLRERTPEIWLKKLDWIARRGGMALVNIHPDYLRFPGEPASPNTYPVEFYRQLLRHVKDRQAGICWQPLARELAEFGAVIRPQRAGAVRRRIAMIAYSVYQRDNRVIRYAEALAGRGDAVDVIALKKQPGHAAVEKVGRVQVYRLRGRYAKNQKRQGEYLLPIIRFWFTAMLRLTRNQLRRRYDLIHVHNMPDFLVFAAWLPKLMGARVILDIHDIMPEFYASKFGGRAGGDAFGVRLLKRMERASAGFAHHVIISNHLWLKPYASRSAPERKCSVFINYVNQTLFHRRKSTRRPDRRIIMFPGGLHWHQGLDIAIRAMPAVVKRIPDAEFHIYGDGNQKSELVNLARELNLTETVRFFDPRPVSEIAQVMSTADLGVVPKRADSFGNEAYSTKIMEFMSLGVPMVVSSTKIDRYYFNDAVVRFFESGSPDALAAAIIEVLQDDGLRTRLVANALNYADENSWRRRQGDYLELVDSLIENRTCRPGPNPPKNQSEEDQEQKSQRSVNTDAKQLALK